MTQPPDIRDIIQQYPPSDDGRRALRLLACGHLHDVNSAVHRWHVRGCAEVSLWSPPLPSPAPGEVIRIMTMYVNLRG